MAAAKQSLDEGELLKRLRVRNSEKAGNGYAHAFIPKVRNAAGFSATRTIDAYAMSLWPSRGLTLTAYECKSSRSDWLREIKKPDKAEAFCELADYFYIVAGGTDIVRAGELPVTWGLMVPHGAHLRVEVQAPRLRMVEEGVVPPFPPGVDRSFLAALLRAACAVGDVTPAAVEEAVAEARRLDREHRDRFDASFERRYSDLAAQVKEFQEASGIPLSQRWPEQRSPKEIGRLVKLVLRGEHETDVLESRLRRIREDAQQIAAAADAQLTAVED